MIETKTEDYKSHKHTYNVYVEINSKTKLGQDLLEQYRKQAKKQYCDIGRIGYHDDNGRYIIDHYSLFELISVPKLIIGVTEKAINKAGRDEYRLRTYMSKFGQLNFLLLVDRSCAELILVENVFIENLNHKEDYETTIYKLRYSPSNAVPLRAIFYKFGIRANPDDYGKAWKNEGTSINNIIVAKAKAQMTVQIANKLASDINQKALITSLNYLNKEGTYGKNVTKEYSKKVSKSKELNELSTSPKLENTLNNVLVKTLEQQTTRTDVKDKTNYHIYKKVLDVELSSHSEVKKQVAKANNKQNLKEFLMDTYEKHTNNKENEEKENEAKFKVFETIIEKQYTKKPNKEYVKPIEEDFKPEPNNIPPKQEYYDFENKKVEIDFNLDRFKKPQDEAEKLAKKQQEKLQKKKEKKQNKVLKKLNKNLKVLNAECDLDNEFEKSKLTLGILPSDSKKKKKKALKIFFREDDKKKKVKEKEETKKQSFDNANKFTIIEKIEKQIRSQKIFAGKNSGNKENQKNTKKQVKQAIKLEKDISRLEQKSQRKQLKNKNVKSKEINEMLFPTSNSQEQKTVTKSKSLFKNNLTQNNELNNFNLNLQDNNNQELKPTIPVKKSLIKKQVKQSKKGKKLKLVVQQKANRNNIKEKPNKGLKDTILSTITSKKKNINSIILEDNKKSKEKLQPNTQNTPKKTNQSALNLNVLAQNTTETKQKSRPVSKEVQVNNIIDTPEPKEKEQSVKEEFMSYKAKISKSVKEENKTENIIYDYEETTYAHSQTTRSTENNYLLKQNDNPKKQKKGQDFGREM